MVKLVERKIMSKIENVNFVIFTLLFVFPYILSWSIPK